MFLHCEDAAAAVSGSGTSGSALSQLCGDRPAHEKNATCSALVQEVG